MLQSLLESIESIQQSELFIIENDECAEIVFVKTFQPKVKNFIYFKYKDYLSHEQFQSLWNKAGYIGILNNVNLWLSDSCEMKVLNMEDVAWFSTVWTPNIVENIPTTHYASIVLGDSVFAELSATKVIADIQNKEEVITQRLEAHYTTDLKSAVEWLFKV